LERVVRIRDPLFVLGLSQIFVTGATLAFYFGMRPELLEAYGAERIGWAASLALSAWFAPSLAGAGVLFAIAGALTRGARRMRVVGVGLIVSGLGFVGAVLSAVAPLLRG
jgi:hypothetical protein